MYANGGAVQRGSSSRESVMRIAGTIALSLLMIAGSIVIATGLLNNL